MESGNNPFTEISLEDVRLFGDPASEARGVAGVEIVLTAKADCSLLDWIPVGSRLRAPLFILFRSALIPTHEENDAMLWYIVLRGASSFLMETGRWPGSSVPYRVRGKQTGEFVGDQTSGIVNSNAVSRSGGEANKNTHHIVEADLPAFRMHLNRVLRAFGIASNRLSWDYVDVSCASILVIEAIS
ncbi:unnamed protein product [Echinostoma caproni]|uniref:tRNA pseudouridine synthase n=1 Tax=Echinostoma caproni TaxID=27848 RepID=A0A183B0Y2_9TREM|nr:unnamed protein product [Echinostoma caproni]